MYSAEEKVKAIKTYLENNMQLNYILKMIAI